MAKIGSFIQKGDDIMIAIKDIEKIKEIQVDHGGWNHSMNECLIGPCKLMQVIGSDAIVRGPSGNVYKLNSKLLSRFPTERNHDDLTVEKFQKGDIVKISDDLEKTRRLQIGHGSWLSSMKLVAGRIGKVYSILPSGDVNVNVNGMGIVYNPLLLTKSRDKPNLEVFAPGDEKRSRKHCQPIDNNQTMKFFFFLKIGNINEVRNLVDLVGVNTKLEGIYPLTIAINEGHYDIAKFLTEKKADLDVIDNNGDTFLHLAVLRNRYEFCELLLKKGADVNAQNNYKLTPVMLAAATESLNILDLLANSDNSDLNIGDSFKNTALHLAVQNLRMDSVEILLNAGADIKKLNIKKMSAFHLSVLLGHENILEMFLKREGERIVDFLIEDKYAAIHLAALKNHEGCLRVLLKYKADINIRNDMLLTALHLAVLGKSFNCMKILVENKAEIHLKDRLGNTPLHLAMINGNRKKDSLSGLRDFFELTMFVDLGSDNQEDIVMYLVENGAKTDIHNISGLTPLDMCNDESIRTKIINFKNEKSPKSHSTMTELSQETTFLPMATPATPLITESDGGMTVVDNSFQSSLLKSKDEELEVLHEIIHQMEDEKTCVICCDRQKNVTFGCGHMACAVCTKNLVECHICRKYIENKIRMI